MKKTLRIFSLFSTVLLLFLWNVTAVFADTGSMTLTVQIPCKVSLLVGEHGKVCVDGAEYTANANVTKDIGSIVTYEVSANFLYKIDKVLYNGTDITDELVDGKYTASSLSENVTFSATFRFILGGGSSEPTPESTTETPSDSGSLVTTSTKTLSTAGTESKPSASVAKSVPAVTVVDPVNLPDTKTDVNKEIDKSKEPEKVDKTVESEPISSAGNSTETEGVSGTGTTEIPPTNIPKSERGIGFVGIAGGTVVILLFGATSFAYLKKKKTE